VMDHREIGFGYVDFISLVQDRNRWRDPVKTAMYLRALKEMGNVLTAEQLLACRKELCPNKLFT
jgi:hypothetical protein